MGMRRQAREWALQFLFQRDFHGENLPEDLAQFWEGKTPSPSAKSFTEQLVYGVERRRLELDKLISSCADNWDIDRMGGVDRNVMRIAVHEMTSDGDVPAVVAIDEAVEIAKLYSSNESGRFVNGILDRALSKLKQE